jgi:superfamily II DNA helicase RecQ
MGIDTPDIRYVVHWGWQDFKCYKGLKMHMDESMVKYCTNQDKCRKFVILMILIEQIVVVRRHDLLLDLKRKR